MKRGVPDFIFIKNGRPIGLELKAAGAYQNADQRELEREWVLAGGVYFCAKGYTAAADFLAAMEIITPIREGGPHAPRQAAEVTA